MKVRGLCSVLAFGALAGVIATASADVINFDDLSGSGAVPPGYGTVADWGSWTYYDASQPPYNPNSPPTRIYNYTDQTFRFGREVEVEGAYFSGYGSTRGFNPISFQLYLNNVLVHTSASLDLLDGSGPTWLGTGYTGGVDTVVLTGSAGYYVMDDVTFHEVGGYRLSVRGQCPGQVTVEWNGATPSTQQGLVFGASQGSTTIPSGACQGTVLGIQGQVRLINTFGTGPNGSGTLSGNAGTGACGAFLQLVEVPSCNVSNVGQIP